MTSITTSCFPSIGKRKKRREEVDWFEETFGFREKNYGYVRKQFRLENDDTILHSLANGRKFHIGKFETPSMIELNERLTSLIASRGKAFFEKKGLEFEHLIGDARSLLYDQKNKAAVFQAASRFNCLEMPHSQAKPDSGISTYAKDHTQSPTNAVACCAGTVYRNYFVNKYGQGGKKGKQIDCLADTAEFLENEKDFYWKMQNGYALPTDRQSMLRLKKKLYEKYLTSRKAMNTVRVGVQWNTEVVKKLSQPNQSHHCVTQVYCAALPISYCTNSKMKDFEPFAKLILDAAYCATFAVAAIKSLESNQRVKLYLTKVGGGVFGNRSRWVADAIKKNLRKFEDFPLDVHLVHYGTLEQPYLQSLGSTNKVDSKSLITKYFASNINVSRLLASPATTVCSNDDSTALLTSSSPNYSDESVLDSTSSTSEVTKNVKVNNTNKGIKSG